MRTRCSYIRATSRAILREGAFTTPSDGLPSLFANLLRTENPRHSGHDNRQPQRPLTILLNRACWCSPRRAHASSCRMQYRTGEAKGARLSVLGFDRYVFDLDQYAGPQRASDRDTSERYLAELLDAQSAPAVPAVRRGVYLAEAITGFRRRLLHRIRADRAGRDHQGRMARASYRLAPVGSGLDGRALSSSAMRRRVSRRGARSSISSFICCR